MEEADGLADALAGRKADFARVSAEIEVKRAGVREGEGRHRARRAELAGRREVAAARLTAETLGRYERIGRARGGLAVVIAHDDRCPACQVRLRPQLFEEIRMRDAIRSCESCWRILFFEPRAEPEAGNDAEPAVAPAG